MPKLSLLPRPSNVSGSASKDPSFRSLPFSYGKGQGETETPTQTVEGVSSLPGVVQPPYRAGSGARLSSPTSLVRYLPPKISICTQRSRCPEIPRGGTEKILPPASTEIQKYRDLRSYDRDLCVTNRLRGASPVRPTVRKKRQKKSEERHARALLRALFAAVGAPSRALRGAWKAQEGAGKDPKGPVAKQKEHARRKASPTSWPSTGRKISAGTTSTSPEAKEKRRAP